VLIVLRIKCEPRVYQGLIEQNTALAFSLASHYGKARKCMRCPKQHAVTVL